MIADPVGQCALTTVAEDTVQFVAAVTDQCVAHLARGTEARRSSILRVGAWPLTGSPVAIIIGAASRVNGRL
jgi:hypothetical protein